MGLDRSAHLESAHGAEVTWLPFFLHPEIPAGGLPARRVYARLHPDGARGYLDHLASLAAEIDLPFGAPDHVPRTARTLMASDWVRVSAPARFGDFHRALFHAYWADNRDIESREVLGAIAQDHDIDPDAMLSGVEGADADATLAVHRDRAYDHGISGTPGWVINGSLMIPGAQPRAVFDRMITRLLARG